ncbi:hypothetical protein [Streptomyces lomondensis]|uniref:Uncharacterized protein n=1 Tax=Streptomyces lomondensis TaxID=68229 RepID=A0ABQ2XIR4_9ACTN|nr:hypothetical protein [Streptomyces lomondensis]MCF0079511.1 hypothetical protein [Streptomyces lomondensis]GGX18413.1 hypothetical protein GCM10010383_55520 [Streptomyces lomondensis]
MTARPVAKPSTSSVALRIPTGAPLLQYFSASMDRRSLITVASGHHRPVVVAVEADGSLSKRLFASDPALPGMPGPTNAPEVSAPSFKSLERGTIQLAHALRARQAALEGGEHLVDRFTLEVLGRRGARWREAVSTALLGDWAAPLNGQGRLGLDALAGLRREAEALHRQLMPLWRRRTLGHRWLLLDTPLGDGLTLYDLVADRAPHRGDPAGCGPDDAGLAAVLSALHPDERAVAMARGQAGVMTWAEAALVAGATDPVAAGERVRRKLRRLAALHRQRTAAATATRAAAA